jgi:outer membrane protein TolC
MKRIIAYLLAVSVVQAESPVRVEKPVGRVWLRAYKRAYVPPPRLTNSSRIHDLIRANHLYLTVQDAIAIALENNIDLEIDRYAPLTAMWQYERAQAGGPLRGVTNGNTLVNQVTSGQGVVGSQVSAGLNTNNGTGGNGGGGAIVSQIGPVTANLDPVLQNATGFSHTTMPQPNPLQSQTSALVDTRHIYNTVVQEGLLSGGYVQVAANESYLKENTPTDILNPSVAPVVQFYMRHNLLQGFGAQVNNRFIRVARRNIEGSSETNRSQLLNLVSQVLNLYWDLVSDINEFKARQHTLEVAQKFYLDTRKEIEIGAVARVEIYRAEAEYTSRQRELAISEASVRQQENLLKNILSRNGLEDPQLEAVTVVPLDRIEIPSEEALPPLRDLVASAIRNRPDVALSLLNDQTAEISAQGTENGVLPQLQGIVAIASNGLAGTSVPQPGGIGADPKFTGGIGKALGQVFSFDYYTRRAAIVIQGAVHNRIAQGDYGVEQLQLRQGDLVSQRARNQLIVDISNQVVALRQARSRYVVAAETRALQEQLLTKEEQRFSLGSSTIENVIAVQRILTAAQQAEVASLATYSRARVSLDQVLGETLERNHVSMDDSVRGEVTRKSVLPEVEDQRANARK